MSGGLEPSLTVLGDDVTGLQNESQLDQLSADALALDSRLDVVESELNDGVDFSNLIAPYDARITSLEARRLGGSYVDAVDDLGVVIDSSAAAAANTAMLNSWGDALGATSDRVLSFPAGFVHLSGNGWVLPSNVSDARMGGRIQTAGVPVDAVGFGETVLGKSCFTQFVGDGLSRVVTLRNAGLSFNVWSIAGFYAATANAYRTATTTRADVGLLLADSPVAEFGAPSEIVGQVLTLVACETGVQCGTTDLGNQTDFLNLQKLAGINCGRLLYLYTAQSTGHVFGQIHAKGCDIVIHARQGGGVTCSQLYAQKGGASADCTLLYTERVSLHHNVFNFSSVTWDGSLFGTVKIWDSQNGYIIPVTMQHLKIPKDTTTVSASLKSYNNLVIGYGEGLREGMFHGAIDIDGVVPTVFIGGGHMEDGHDMDAMYSTAGTNNINIVYQNVREYLAADATLPSPRVVQKVRAGVLT